MLSRIRYRHSSAFRALMPVFGRHALSKKEHGIRVRNGRTFLCGVVISTLACLGCDAFMRINAIVKDPSGAPIEDATVALSIIKTKRKLGSDKTSSEGLAQHGSVYGFRSGPRLLTVTKAGYKPFETSLEPKREYTCHVVLNPEAKDGSSSGSCQN